jgi:hypothetical protein
VARFTRDLRPDFESDTKLRCPHCRRVFHLGGRGTDVMLAALATGSADVYLDDVASATEGDVPYGVRGRTPKLTRVGSNLRPRPVAGAVVTAPNAARTTARR